MPSINDKYKKLYNKASNVDDRVDKVRNDKYSPTQIGKDYIDENGMIEFGEHLATKLESDDKEIPEEVIKLIQFTVDLRNNRRTGGTSTSSGSSSYFASAMSALDQAAKASDTGAAPSGVTKCKDPLGPGEMSFDDIAGQEETKENIKRSYIYPYKFPELFPTKSKGIMFYGPPGTGKTLLAKAATAEIPGAAFFAPTPGEMRGKYEGETEKNIARVFECADQIIGKPMLVKAGEEKSKEKRYRVAVIFIDEFDSLAGLRGDDPGMSRSVNALLQGMDGIKSSPNVSVIAATNFPWKIDDAVLRRFSAKIFIDLPNLIARQFLMRSAIAKVYELPSIKRTTNIMRKNPNAKIKKQSIIRRDFNPDAKKFEISWNDGIFEGIKEYGKPLCTSKTYKDVTVSTYYGMSKTIEHREKEITRLISGKYIEKICERTHKEELNIEDLGLKMTEKSQELVEKIKSNQEVDASDIKDEDRDYWFGYSGSDIDKIMDLAIQNAASRALENAFKVIKIEDTLYFIATKPENENAKYTITDEANQILYAEHGKKFKILSPDKALQALNYSLCQGDIVEGMKKYPSTIKNRSYVDLLLFEYQGIVPKKKDEE
jgi:SpoVK/Ycf46/Vps4 family AAA+-type ATPase